ncbi:unnamed protein product [Didymodactylos carnosus]|nr:unnamed protein product [Didymodactylos carnosus]CAF3497933.1 unnamed protein product [Didymodactylos carnosus]
MSIQTLSSCLVGTLGQYIYQYYFHSYVTNSTITPTFHTIQQQLCPNNVNSSSDAQQWAQQQSSNLFFWQNLASSLPVIIMTYLLGIYTSKLGKKIVLILPILGTVIQLSIWLAIIYFNLKEYWWLIAAFIQGLSGSGGVFGFIITLIITDTTLENDRSASVLRVVGMKLLQYMGSNDPLICAISHIFLIISALWTSFAKHSWELYVGILISPFTSYQASLTYSMLSKWLEPHETANTFALVTEISTIISAFGTSFFNFVYSKTIPYSRNFTMLLAGGLAIIPLILNICLYIITRNLPDTQTDIATETTPLLLPDHMLVRGIDPTFNIISASSSLTNSLRTPTLRSRSNSAGSALEYSTETEPLLKV